MFLIVFRLPILVTNTNITSLSKNGCSTVEDQQIQLFEVKWSHQDLVTTFGLCWSGPRTSAPPGPFWNVCAGLAKRPQRWAKRLEPTIEWHGIRNKWAIYVKNKKSIEMNFLLTLKVVFFFGNSVFDWPKWFFLCHQRGALEEGKNDLAT